jgi:hypothetical protein
MPNQFAEEPYFFEVVDVDIRDACGYLKVARMVHVIYAVYRPTNRGAAIPCGQKIAMHFAQEFEEEVWHFEPRDHPLVAAMGLESTLAHGVDVAGRLRGRWIEGRPGPAGPDGFNPLSEVRSIATPPVLSVGRELTGSSSASRARPSSEESPRPLPAATTDCHPSPGPIDLGPHEPDASISTNRQSLDQALVSIATSLHLLKAELDRLPERIAERSGLSIRPASTTTSEVPHGPATPGPEVAYRSYQVAEQALGRKITDDEAYAWLAESGPAEYELPSPDAWKRRLRRARQHYGDQKHRPIAGRRGRCVVPQPEM